MILDKENIKQRPKGIWEGKNIIGIDFSNNPIYETIYGNTYEEVSKILKIKDISYPKRFCLFEEKINEWLEYEKISLKVSTYSYYHTVVDNHIRKELGIIPLNELDNKIISNFINKLYLKHISESTIKQILKILKQIFKFCNLEIKLNMPKSKRKEISILSDDENDILLKYLYNNMNNKNFSILLSIKLGLRIGEVCALKWSNFDLSSGLVKIEKTVERIKNYDTSINSKTRLLLIDAKTDHSIRVLPLSNSLIEIVNKLIKNENKDSFILTSKDNYMDPRTFFNYYKKVLNTCGIKNTYHCLRHTFATKCVDNGLNIKAVSEILGHSNIQTTLSLYVHPDLNKTRDFFNEKLTY